MFGFVSKDLFYLERLPQILKIKAQIRKCIHVKQLNVITHPFLNVNGG